MSGDYAELMGEKLALERYNVRLEDEVKFLRQLFHKLDRIDAQVDANTRAIAGLISREKEE